MNKLRIWLAYYLIPKDARRYFIEALSYATKQLEREVVELRDEMNVDFYTHDNIMEEKEESK